MVSNEKSTLGGSINFVIIGGIVFSALLFGVANTYEPQIDAQFDIFEFIFALGFVVPGIFSMAVAKRYWGSHIFGRAYFSLGLGFLATGIGQYLWFYYQMKGFVNPYPYYPDILFSLYYPCGIYHLMSNIHFFKRKLNRSQKIMLVCIPTVTTLLYAFALLVPVTVMDGVPDLLTHQITIDDTSFELIPANTVDETHHATIDNTSYNLVPVNSTGSTIYPQIYDKNVAFKFVPLVFTNTKFGEITHHDQIFWNGFFMGTYYVAGTTTIFAYALVGFQIFRKTVLGIPWGLLLAGLGLISIGDIAYYYASIYSYDRTNPIVVIYVTGCMLVSYALLKHRQQL